MLADPSRFAAWWARRWLTPGPLSTAQRAAIEAAIRRSHRMARLRTPVLTLWLTDPDEATRLADDQDLRLDRLVAAAPRYRRWSRPWRLARMCSTAVGYALIWGWIGALVLWVPTLLVSLAPPIRQLAGSLVRAAPWLALAIVVLVTGASLVFGAMQGWRRGRVAAADRPRYWVEPIEPLLAAPIWWGPRTLLRRIFSAPRPGGDRPAPVQPPSGQHDPAGPLALWSLQGWMPRPVSLGMLAALLRRELLTSRYPLRQAWWWRRVLQTHSTAAAVCWRPYRRLVVVLEPPREVHTRFGVPDRMDGPAVVWAGGEEWFFLNGVRLPRRPDAGDWTVEEIHAVTNTEVRRVMIEAIGWPGYIRDAGLISVASAPDPGNPPHELVLYEPADSDRWRGRLLFMTNGSPDRGGGLRHFAEYVPDDMDDPVEAAAWQYGVPVEVYRALQRRT